MSDCCGNSQPESTGPARHKCPVNGREYAEVSLATILHHLRQPWLANLKQQRYFFCQDPDCDVVYFGEDDVLVRQSELRTPVGIKSHQGNATLCYCFGVSREDAEGDPEIRDFVIRQTREKNCACESRNPSGRCCLKDFPS